MNLNSILIRNRLCDIIMSPARPVGRRNWQSMAMPSLAQPSQFSGSEVGMLFVFSKGTSKVSTTFGVEEGDPARQRP
jgi:hypothetical protein